MTDGVNTVNWDGDIIAMVDNNNPGSDTITGDGQANHIYNQDGSGSDTINGGGGNDELVNDNDGNVSDTVDGGTGDDYVSSTGFSDNETTHPDKVFGGEGNNYIVVQEGVGGDPVECGPGTDTVLFDDGDVISPNCERQNPWAVAEQAHIIEGRSSSEPRPFSFAKKTWDLAHLGDAQPAPGELRYSYYLGGCG